MPGVGGLSIANNLLANNISLNLNNSEKKLSNLSKQLSSGLRINSSADDPSGYAIATLLQTQVDGYDQGSRNVQDANNAATVANGALTSATNILSRLRTLSIEASSDLISATDRNSIQVEFQQLIAEINHISATTNFNGINLLDGSHAGFQAAQQAQLTIQTNVPLNGSSGNLIQAVTISALSNTSVDGTYVVQVVNGLTSATTPSVIISYISSVGLVGTQLTLISFASGAFNFTAPGLGTISVGTVANTDIGSTAYIKELQFVTAAINSTQPALTFQGGPNEGAVIALGLPSVSASTLRISNLNVTAVNTGYNSLASEDAIGQIDYALNSILYTQGQLGAVVQRLDQDQDNNNIASVNLQASESDIRDLNVAEASAQYTSTQILVQAGTSLLSQANTNAQTILQLFR